MTEKRPHYKLQFRTPSESARDSFKFHKRSQYFIRPHNETLSVPAMRVRNPDRSAVRIQGCHPAPTPTGFAEIVGDDLPGPSCGRILPLLRSTKQ